jgi:hypothetical protein
MTYRPKTDEAQRTALLQATPEHLRLEWLKVLGDLAQAERLLAHKRVKAVLAALAFAAQRASCKHEETWFDRKSLRKYCKACGKQLPYLGLLEEPKG